MSTAEREFMEKELEGKIKEIEEKRNR